MGWTRKILHRHNSGTITLSGPIMEACGLDGVNEVEVTQVDGGILIKPVKPVGGITFPIQIAERLCEDWNELQWMCGQMAGRQLAEQMATMEAAGNGGDEAGAGSADGSAAVDNSTLF